MICNQCAKEIKKSYGTAKECSPCYIRRLNLSSRGLLEMQKLKATIKTLRTQLSNMKVSLNTAFRKNEKLKAENDEWESDFEKQHKHDIKQRNGESVWAKDFVA